VVVDIANACINIGGEEGSLAFDLTFVYFDRQGKSNINDRKHDSQELPRLRGGS
jgi:hypothetical protein